MDRQGAKTPRKKKRREEFEFCLLKFLTPNLNSWRIFFLGVLGVLAVNPRLNLFHSPSAPRTASAFPSAAQRNPRRIISRTVG